MNENHSVKDSGQRFFRGVQEQEETVTGNDKLYDLYEHGLLLKQQAGLSNINLNSRKEDISDLCKSKVHKIILAIQSHTQSWQDGLKNSHNSETGT